MTYKGKMQIEILHYSVIVVLAVLAVSFFVLALRRQQTEKKSIKCLNVLEPQEQEPTPTPTLTQPQPQPQPQSIASNQPARKMEVPLRPEPRSIGSGSRIARKMVVSTCSSSSATAMSFSKQESNGKDFLLNGDSIGTLSENNQKKIENQFDGSIDENTQSNT